MNEIQPIKEYWGPLPRVSTAVDEEKSVVLSAVEASSKSNFHKISVGVIVSALNEEKVIADSLAGLLEIIDPAHIYLVSDGSKDKTAEIASSFIPNVLNLSSNVGKANALNALIKHYRLADRYEYLLFTDADSRLAPDFLVQVQSALSERPACVVGTVASHRKGLISAYRVYEYGFSHRVFKRAQGIASLISIAPGCASLYRTDVLTQLDFSGRTLTEDFDLTLQIHERKLGQIIYARDARVITQDPYTLKDYWRQIMRWYTGFWQNVRLHKIYQPNSMLHMEIWLSLIDSFSWIFALLLAVFVPHIFLLMLASTAVLVGGFAVLVLALERQLWAIRYLPIFPMFQLINTCAYLASIVRAFRPSEKLNWHKVARYAS